MLLLKISNIYLMNYASIMLELKHRIIIFVFPTNGNAWVLLYLKLEHEYSFKENFSNVNSRYPFLHLSDG